MCISTGGHFKLFLMLLLIAFAPILRAHSSALSVYLMKSSHIQFNKSKVFRTKLSSIKHTLKLGQIPEYTNKNDQASCVSQYFKEGFNILGNGLEGFPGKIPHWASSGQFG